MTMNKLTRTSLGGALALALFLPFMTACGDDSPKVTPDAPDMVKPKTFRQIEHLARPAVNEALLISNDFLNGYNATAPSFVGVDKPTLDAVVGEAKTVLKALYLGACLLDGAVGLTPTTGLHPAGIQCHAVGGALWVGGDPLTGTVLTPESKAAAQAYADKVFDQFVPDVMRLDTSLAVSTYLSLCGDANSKPLLCGGRFLNNDVIDITYNYFLAGAAVKKTDPVQFTALVSDGVEFSTDDTKNVGNTGLPDPTNKQQFHPDVTPGFPYSAPPF
jgi:Domain of unknown function (DUF4331)